MAKVAVSASALVAAVKRNPILWDSREDSYKLSEDKPAFWQQIVEELGSDQWRSQDFVMGGFFSRHT
jgi:hypothetical protein